ncbi:hypothetical protein AMD27_17435 (plasmid) [Acinetobacter sp. TGL-Y2]|uniref:hypothetical protein n=1 Tax=Acinetobacter sp. TGL-Y2 TaxID=1407071 RepID=UPI0007A666D1|nr:hypothetical protein [Acinetobacter sp. TGL-Y2]AMW80699.1 hypothetical protein AMD27_17435 [Acinetobacter sp. TGL-Y2]
MQNTVFQMADFNNAPVVIALRGDNTDTQTYIDDLDPAELAINITNDQNQRIMLWSRQATTEQDRTAEQNKDAIVFDVDDLLNHLNGEQAIKSMGLHSNLKLSTPYTPNEVFKIFLDVLQKQSLAI